MKRTTKTIAVSALALTALMGTVGGLIATTAQPAEAQRYRAQPRRRPVNRTGVLSWTAAQGQPRVDAGRSVTGFYIWHDRNTVHIVSNDRTKGRDIYSGTVEITGRNAKLDTLRNEYGERGDRFGLVGDDKVTFRFDTHQAKDGFAFNLRGGQRLVFRLNRDGRKTGRIFYGPGKTEAYGDPVVFDLDR